MALQMFTRVCVCVAYLIFLHFAFGLVKLVLQVPDDLFAFGVALLGHLPLPLRLLRDGDGVRSPRQMRR